LAKSHWRLDSASDYKRKTKAHGIVSGQMPPIKPPPPKL